MRVIKNIESTSIGNTNFKNDDEIYIGENYAAVIDGVSSKSAIIVNGEKIRIADIIIDAIKRIDSKNAPTYAKELNLNEFLQIINMYIKKFYDENKISLEKHKLEATGAIYSKFFNQIWMVGDCRAIYDGKTIEHELEADELYAKIRYRVIQGLLKEGYTADDIFKHDISRVIIDDPARCIEFIKDGEETQKILKFILDNMHQALIDTGFTEEQIKSENLLQKYYNPQTLQEYAKNNPNAKKYGYSVFNGIYTPVENCIIENLPDDVKTIRLSTDGFPMKVLKRAKDLGSAIRMNRVLSQNDPISIGKNYGIHNSYYQDSQNHLAFDDESAIEIRIEEIDIGEIER